MHSGVGYSPQNVHILPFPGAYYRHVSGIYFFQIRKIDGSPSVLHLFRRDWMILKAGMLLYTRVVVSIALQQRLCAKKYPNTIFCFGIFGGDGECNIHVQACFLHTTSAGGHY